MISLGAVWAFLGLPGLREIALVVLVGAGVVWSVGAAIDPAHPGAAALARGGPASCATLDAGAPGTGFELEDRAFWILAITAATAVAAWMVTRMMIVGGPGPGPLTRRDPHPSRSRL